MRYIPKPDLPPPSCAAWRAVLPVHPAADLFPMMSADELKVLGKDIKKNGQRVSIILLGEKDKPVVLLDGRNRLDAMEAVGLPVLDKEGKWLHAGIRHVIEREDPYGFVISANIHRRHLTAAQKRDVIAEAIKAQPSKSSRVIAEQAKVDHKTVTAVRNELESTGEIPQLTKTVGADGKARTTISKKPKKQRRDVDDYLAEKKACLTAKDIEAPEPDVTASIGTVEPVDIIKLTGTTEPVDSFTLANVITFQEQVNAPLSELASFGAWCKAHPGSEVSSALVRALKDAAHRMQAWAQEIEGGTSGDDLDIPPCLDRRERV